MRFSNRMLLLAAAALGIVADVFAMGDAYSARMRQAHVAAFAGPPRELFLFTRDGLNPENVCSSTPENCGTSAPIDRRGVRKDFPLTTSLGPGEGALAAHLPMIRRLIGRTASWYVHGHNDQPTLHLRE